MKRSIMNITKSITPIVGMVVFAGLTQEAQAMPMFTAQTGMDCAGCHTQHMPRLNKLGRKFAASGMTISKIVSDMDRDDTGLFSDTDINPSMLIKSKYNKTYDKPNGKGAIDTSDGSTNEGEFSPIRMASIFLGGRLSENVGAILKLGHREEEGESIGGKAVYAHAMDDDQTYVGAVFFSTASLGPFSGMEFYNTGLYKPLRMFDMKIYNNTVQKQKIGSQAATGLQVYYDRDSLFDDEDHFFVTAGVYTPAQDSLYYDMTDNLIPFARVAYEYMYSDYNFIFGGFVMSGGDIVADTSPLSIKRETYGIDLQIEGEVMDREVTFAATKVFKNDVEYSGINSAVDEYDTESMYDEGFSVQAAVSMTDAIIGKVSYMHYNDTNEYRSDNLNGTTAPSDTTKVNVKDLDYAIGLGVDYGFVVTGTAMKLAVEYAWMEPSLERVEKFENFMVTFTLPF